MTTKHLDLIIACGKREQLNAVYADASLTEEQREKKLTDLFDEVIKSQMKGSSKQTVLVTEGQNND